MNKNIAITFIVILSVMAIALTGVFIFLLRGNFSWSTIIYSSYSENMKDKKTFDSANEINIDSKAIDLFIEESLDDKITVELYSEKEIDYEVNNNDNNLYIKAYIEKYFNIGIFNKASKLVIKVPKDYSNKFTIDNKVGDIHISSFENLKPTIKVETGDVKINKVYDANIDIGTGDVKVENIKSLTVKQGTGDIKVTDVDNIDVSANTGDVKITNVYNKINITNSTGDIRIQTASIKEDSYIKNKTGDVRIASLTDAYIEADNNIGDIKVNNNDRKLEKVIKIHTNTGDIRVN